MPKLAGSFSIPASCRFTIWTSNPVDRPFRRLDYHLILRPISSRVDDGRRAGPAGLGVDPQLRSLVPGDGPEVTGTAEPGRTAQRDAVSCRMAPEPADLGVTRRLSQPSPKSVTSRKSLDSISISDWLAIKNGRSAHTSLGVRDLIAPRLSCRTAKLDCS